MRVVQTTITGLAVCMLAGCTGGVGPGAVKAGATSVVRHVAMADSQPPDAPSSIAMGQFAAHVRDLSKGTILIDATSAGEFADNAGDAKVVEALTKGRIQLATVPTRAWSDIGVRSADVLQAPFEVRSNAHMEAVAKDTNLVSRALSGLDPRGVHGLGVVPERLRVLVGFAKPVARPADLAGQPVRSISSSIGEVLTDLGARWVNPTDDEYAAMRTAGTVRASETDYERAQSLASGATISADLVLYAKFESIAANGAWWKGLNDADRAVLTTAARMTLEDTLGTLRQPADDAAVFCGAGGSIISVGNEVEAQFRSLVAKRVAALDHADLAALRADRPAVEDPPPPACAPSPGSLDPAHLVADGGALPAGVYRIQWTEAFARQWNAQNRGILFSGQDAPGNFRAMTFTWTLKGGSYRVELVRDAEAPIVRTGYYQVKGDQMLLELPPDFGDVVNRVRWRVNADRSLTLTQVDGLNSDPYYGLRWIRIGDA